MYDVIIIGCGVVGASIAFELSKYDIKIAVLEKENDVAAGTTKANSAIAHAGYDAEPGTLMARFNLAGSEMMEALCSDLSIHYKKCGSLVVAFNEEELKFLRLLFERGKVNNVKDLCILSQKELREIEPSISETALGALHAPTGAVISPWELCIAQIETAVKNGCDLFLKMPAEAIEKIEGGFVVRSGDKEYKTRFIVNAAGLYADKVHEFVSSSGEFKIFPNKGEYFVLDKSQGTLVNHVIFQVPSIKGKGVLVAPTVHGNLLAGPDSAAVLDKEMRSTTPEGLGYVRERALFSVPSINFREVIRTFTGLRAYSTEEDFIIRESKDVPGFINVAGIKSPGLTAAPAIGVYVAQLLLSLKPDAVKKESFVSQREKLEFKFLSAEKKNELIKQNPAYGRIVCRCETVTEGDILNALNSNPSPVSVDGVKRRTTAGFGRCQGGFCSPKVIRLIADYHGLSPEEVMLEGEGSFILSGRTKGESCEQL